MKLLNLGAFFVPCLKIEPLQLLINHQASCYSIHSYLSFSLQLFGWFTSFYLPPTVNTYYCWLVILSMPFGNQATYYCC